MIKTHKPRGHIWTHASTFQQSKEFRDICFEECIAVPGKALVRDADEDLSKTERAAKRRRIEKLADDFLNGKPLFISSARPCAQDLKSTIVWNKKSSSEPKFVIPVVDRSEESSGASAAWEDVESDAETLERLKRRQLGPAQSETSELVQCTDVGAPGESVDAEEAQASCGRVRRLRKTKITAGPSEDALKQAAALRARRLKRVNSEIPVVPNSLPMSAQVKEAEVEPRSEPSYEIQKKRESHRTSQWLSRRQSRFSFAAQDTYEDSIDELQLPGFETPLEDSRRSKHQLAVSEKTIDDMYEEPEPIPAVLGGRHDSFGTAAPNQRSYSRTHIDEHSPHGASYHTAPDDIGIEAECEQAPVHEIRQCDNARQKLSPKRGVMPLAARLSWSPVNPNTTPAEQQQKYPEPVSKQHNRDDSKANVSENAIREALLDSAKQNASRPTKGRRAQSAGNITSQQSSASRGDQRTLSKSAYTTAQSSQNGSTPLLYRKGRLGSHEAGSKRRERENWQTPVTVQEPDPIEVVVEDSSVKNLPTVGVDPPLLDMSFDHDSSFAPKLNMALVDEHLNSILPTSPDSQRRSSNIKKAIRRELRNSGAEISRCESEHPTSCQAEPSSNLDHLRTEEPEPIESYQEKWAGTQFLLKQAQKDLIPSPEKQNTVDGSVNEATPHTRNDAAVKEIDSREKLRRHSQEPMPSTQQLLGEFDGWSTVKKPRAIHRSSPLPTPTAIGKNRPMPLHSTRGSLASSGLDITTDGAGQRRSSLRFSVPIVSSPCDSSLSNEPAHIQSSPSKLQRGNVSTPAVSLFSRDSQQRSTLLSLDASKQLPDTPSTEGNLTLESFTLRPPLSFPGALAQSELLREPSNLSETIEDLTKDVLCMEDMDTVLSQVG